MAKKEKKEDQVLKFDAIRPFGPTIVKGKLPDFLVKLMDDKASEMMNDKEYSKICPFCYLCKFCSTGIFAMVNPFPRLSLEIAI